MYSTVSFNKRFKKQGAAVGKGRRVAAVMGMGRCFAPSVRSRQQGVKCPRTTGRALWLAWGRACRRHVSGT